MCRPKLSLLALVAVLVGCENDVIRPTTRPGDAALSLHGVPAGPVVNTDHELVLSGAELREGVTADLVTTVYVNEATPCRSPNRTMIAMHGAGHTAQMFGPLAEAMFTRGDEPLCRLAALELPGQGKGPLPSGALYGELGLDGMAAAMIAQLDGLEARNFRGRTLIAHSRGTLLTQYVQQELLSRGSSLRAAYGIDRVVLLNGFGGSNTPWFSRDVLNVWETVIESRKTFVPDRGWVVALDVGTWLALWFTNLEGGFHPQAPTPAEVAAEGYMSDEPVQLGLDSAVPGPVIEPGIFAPDHGTRLFMVSGTNDFVSIPPETAVVYQHLTGDATLSGMAVIDDPFAVHSQLMADPRGFLDAIASVVPLP